MLALIRVRSSAYGTKRCHFTSIKAVYFINSDSGFQVPARVGAEKPALSLSSGAVLEIDGTGSRQLSAESSPYDEAQHLVLKQTAFH